jgi:hypothetical protein
MNTASNTRLQLNYPSWSRPRSHWSATDPRNQQTTFRAKTHQHAQRKLARLAAYATPLGLMACPVRPVTPVRPVDRTGQASGYSSRTTDVPESLSDFSRPWNKKTSKTQPPRKKNPSPTQAKQLQNCQEQTSNKPTQRHTSQAIHPRKSHTSHTPVKLVTSTSQTGHAWATRDEHHPHVNSSKTNLQSPDSLHSFKQDFGDSRNTSWALHSQVMVHQLVESSGIEGFPPRTLGQQNPQNRATFLTNLGGESKGKEPRSVHAYIPQQIRKKTASKSLPENRQEKPPKITKKTNGDNTSKP